MKIIYSLKNTLTNRYARIWHGTDKYQPYALKTDFPNKNSFGSYHRVCYTRLSEQLIRYDNGYHTLSFTEAFITFSG